MRIAHVIAIIVLFIFCHLAIYATTPYMQFGDTGIVYDAEYSPDGKMIAVGTSTGFHILDAETFNLIHQEFTERKIRIVKWFPDNDRIFIVLDSFTGEIVQPTTLKYNSTSHDHFIYNIKDLKIVSFLYYPIYWHGLGDDPFQQILLTKNSIGISPQSELISIISDKNILSIINQENMEIFKTLEYDVNISSTGISDDGTKLWVGTEINDILVYETNTFSLIKKIQVINKENHVSSIIMYSPEHEYAISTFSRPDSFTTPIYQIQFLYYHDTTFSNNYTELGNAISVGLDSLVYNLFFQTNTNHRLVLEYSQYTPLQPKIKLHEFTNRIRELKQNYLPTYFPNPFSPDGEIMLTNGSYLATSNLLSIGALSNQPTTRILPQKPEPTVIDFHPSIPNTLLTYSTNQNAAENSLLELWDITSKTVITSVTGVVMYEKGSYSPDGLLFASIDQPFNADSSKPNVWETGEIVPDIYLKVFDTNTWQTKYITQIYEDEGKVETDKVSFINISPNSEFILVGIDRNMYLLNENNLIYTFEEIRHNYGYAGAISIDSKEVLVPTYSADYDLSVLDYNYYNIETGEVRIIKKDYMNPIFIKYIGDGTKLLLVDSVGNTTIFDSNLEIEYFAFGQSRSQKKLVCLSSNEKYLFIDHEIWNVESGEMITTFGEQYGELEVIKISPNNKWVATRHEDKILRVWDLNELVKQYSSVKNYDTY